MQIRPLNLLTALPFFAATVYAQPTPSNAPRIVNVETIARIDSTLNHFVSSGTIAGASALVYEDGEEVYYDDFGMADREREVPMDRRTLVQIFSMTKPVTGVALMQLYERGLFDLDDPLANYLPEYADVQVYAGEDTSGNPILEPPHRPITIRDITRHTAGFATGGEKGIAPLLQAADPMNLSNTLAEMSEKLAGVPLAFHPGAQWAYGTSVDVQARLVEVLSGQPFAEYVHEHIFTPLAMTETRYVVPEGDRSRLAAMYERSEDGTLNRQPDDDAFAVNTREWPMTPGGWGLTAPIDDYMRFARMLLGEGELDGVRILQPETVRLMATNHLDDSVTERSWLPSKGQVGFGIDFAVRTEPPASADENPGVVGEFFWDGAASTLFWVDPQNDLTAVLFVQLLPFDGVGLHRSFREAVYGPYITGGTAAPSPLERDGDTAAPAAPKPRVVVTTDPELDDSNSLLRYLLYSTDFRTEGLIYASSQFHWKGDGKGTEWFVPDREYRRFGLNLCPCESWRWAPDERFIDDAVDIYEHVYPNLRVHDPNYPSPEELRAKIRWGNVEFDGDISKDTPGSDLIRDLLLDDDPEPIYLLAWGGASTIARALKSIQERYDGTAEWPTIRARVSRKAILSLSGDQDDTYATYIRPNWPAIRSMNAGEDGVGVGYGAYVFASADNAPYFSVDWTRENISSQGPLGAHYRVWGDGKQMVEGDIFDYFGFSGLTADELRAKGYVVWLPPRPKGEFLGEGDTFTFLNLIDNGLDAYSAETPGGWAGHITINPASKNTADQAPDTTSFADFMRRLEEAGAGGPSTRPPSPDPNFTPAAQNDFAARVLWSVTPTYDDANHNPMVMVRDSRLSARPGETVNLEGTVSDPDGDIVAVHWWRWKDVDTYPGEVSVEDSSSPTTRLEIPGDATPGQTIHLILEATDDGKPALTRYQRVIVSVTR